MLKKYLTNIRPCYLSLLHILLHNSSIVKNADGLLPKNPVDMGVEWMGKSKNRLSSNKYKVSY